MFNTYDISSNYNNFGFNSYIEKINFQTHSHINALGIKLYFVLNINLVGPTSQMLPTKSQFHWLFGSREDYKVFYIGVVAILVILLCTIVKKSFPQLKESLPEL